MQYSEEEYNKFLAIVSSEHGLEIYQEHPHVSEFCISEVPLFKLIYINKTGDILLSFHINANINTSISLHDFIKSKCPLITLVDEYYVDSLNETHVGQDAYIAYELDAEKELIKQQSGEIFIDTEKDFVNLISNYPIYYAGTKKALEDHRNFLKRKRILTY